MDQEQSYSQVEMKRRSFRRSGMRLRPTHGISQDGLTRNKTTPAFGISCRVVATLRLSINTIQPQAKHGFSPIIVGVAPVEDVRLIEVSGPTLSSGIMELVLHHMDGPSIARYGTEWNCI